MIKVANAKCRDLVSRRLPFKGSNLWGNWSCPTNAEDIEKDCIYVVYSYGTHFPLWVYDPLVDRWFGNADNYSVTTSKHRSQSQPLDVTVKWFDTETMKRLTYGGYKQLASDRVLFGRPLSTDDGWRRVTV
jgi:hypothetical protein